MLIVTSINGSQVEPLTHYQGLKIEEEVNGSFVLSFTSFNVPENPGHELLTEECFVTVEDHEFRVKQLSENRYSKSVVATHIFFDLADDRQDTIYGGTHTLSEFATFTLSGTGWTFTTDITESAVIANFGENNVISLINALCSAFKCEFQILPNKVIHFTYQVGPDNDAVYRYKHNVVALSKKVDTTNLKTLIDGYGANGLHVSYTSPNHETFGIRKAEPINDDRFTIADSLLEHIKSQLTDAPEAYFELDSVELTNKEIGERVWLIYEPLNIEFQTRVLKQTKEVRSGEIVTVTVVLGNTLPKSTSDLLVSQKVQIDENKKEYRSRFEQTNEEISLVVERVGEAEASIKVNADNIALKVDKNGVMSAIELTPETIKMQASRIEFTGHIFGEGATFSGNIETLQNVKVGANIEMQGESGGSIRFPATGCWIKAANTGEMSIETWNGLDIIGGVDFHQNVNFTNATVNWGSNKPVAVWG